MARSKQQVKGDGRKIIASNRRARHDYAILDTVEAGIVLTGSEVKALREGHAQIADAFARVIRGEVWLDGVHIPPYQFATGFGAHATDRARKLLMHRREIEKLERQIATEHLALIPLALYFKEGRVKVELGQKVYSVGHSTLGLGVMWKGNAGEVTQMTPESDPKGRKIVTSQAANHGDSGGAMQPGPEGVWGMPAEMLRDQRFRRALVAAIGDRSPYLYPFKRILLWGRKPR